jgi:hypothetical protein
MDAEFRRTFQIANQTEFDTIKNMICLFDIYNFGNFRACQFTTDNDIRTMTTYLRRRYGQADEARFNRLIRELRESPYFANNAHSLCFQSGNFEDLAQRLTQKLAGTHESSAIDSCVSLLNRIIQKRKNITTQRYAGRGDAEHQHVIDRLENLRDFIENNNAFLINDRVGHFVWRGSQFKVVITVPYQTIRAGVYSLAEMERVVNRLSESMSYRRPEPTVDFRGRPLDDSDEDSDEDSDADMEGGKIYKMKYHKYKLKYLELKKKLAQ